MLTRNWILTLVAGLILSLYTLSCRNPTPNNEEVNDEFVFHDELSAYGFFGQKIADLIPADDVLPYELNTPLFSDYAHKARFIKLPKGKTMDLDGDEVVFPSGTILIKNFFYFHNEQKPNTGRRLIETRLLIKTQTEWLVANYEWNEAQTEATRNILGGKTMVNWIDGQGLSRNIQYIIPDNNDCKSCHKSNGSVVPIGPKVKNLNREVTWKGSIGNQLLKWKDGKKLSDFGSLTNLSILPVWDEEESGSLADRARAYLDVNCAHCHNKEGPASNTGLFLDYAEESPHRIGVFKGPVSAAQGSGSLMYNIVPGDATSSIMAYRMNSTKTGVAMPEIGKTIVHDEGVTLIASWINAMEE